MANRKLQIKTRITAHYKDTKGKKNLYKSSVSPFLRFSVLGRCRLRVLCISVSKEPFTILRRRFLRKVAKSGVERADTLKTHGIGNFQDGGIGIGEQ